MWARIGAETSTSTGSQPVGTETSTLQGALAMGTRTRERGGSLLPGVEFRGCETSPIRRHHVHRRGRVAAAHDHGDEVTGFQILRVDRERLVPGRGVVGPFPGPTH